MQQRVSEAVVAVDVQADFTEFRSGSLVVPGTDDGYVREVIEATKEFKSKGMPIVATMDNHPADHVSFFTNHPGSKAFDVVRIGDLEQVLWPPHCVQKTSGAEILIPRDLITTVVETGTRRVYDCYSGFRDDGGNDTGLKAVLKDLGAKRLIVYGLATDVCVRATVLHALEEGFEVKLLLNLSRGITPEGTQAAVEDMRAAGAVIEE
jgi:nicotinamidase/pyrazinamidase